LNFDSDERVGRIVDLANEFFGEDGDVSVQFACGVDDFPVDTGGVGGNAAENFTVEGFDDLRAAPIPPERGRGDFLSIIEEQRVGEIRRGADLRFIEVGGVGRFGIAVGTAAERSDVKKVQGALMILVGSQVNGGRDGLRAAGPSGECSKSCAEQRRSIIHRHRFRPQKILRIGRG
jgi:hypothetical protein